MKRGRFLSLFAIFLCKCALIANGEQKFERQSIQVQEKKRELNNTSLGD